MSDGDKDGDSPGSGKRNPWKSATIDPAYAVENGVASMELPAEVFDDSEPLWRAFAVGYFIGDAPHVGSIHATVNRIWTAPDFNGKIDVQFIAKDTVLFRIENEALRTRVIKRRYWHISDVPLVIQEWSPETAAAPPDLSAMPLWVDLKSVPSHLFSRVGLRALSKPVGNFVKLHPQTERCTRLDVARVLVEVNLHKPLIEAIKFEDQDGSRVKVVVSYPWLPARCSICSKWGHKTKECVSKEVVIQTKEKDSNEMIIVEEAEKVSCSDNAKEVVDNLIKELASLPTRTELGEPTVQAGKDLETDIGVGGVHDPESTNLDEANH